jgi:ABC-type amino acid transport substrate-binding protein
MFASVLRALAPTAALAALLLTAGCGGSRDEDPGLLQEDTLTVALAPPAGGAPTGFDEALSADLANRLDLNLITRAVSSSPAGEAVLGRRVDAAGPAPIRTRTAHRLAYTAPYYQDPATGTLYGLAVLAGPNPRESTALQEDLDEALSEIKDDGTLQKLYDKWIPGTDVPDPVLNDETG